jgi:hypothetical protein
MEPAFIYFSGQNVMMRPRNVIAFDNPDFCTDRVKCCSWTLTWNSWKQDDFRRVMKETYEGLGREIRRACSRMNDRSEAGSEVGIEGFDGPAAQLAAESVRRPRPKAEAAFCVVSRW